MRPTRPICRVHDWRMPDHNHTSGAAHSGEDDGPERRQEVVKTGRDSYAGVPCAVRVVRRNFDPEDDGFLTDPPFLNRQREQYGVEWELPGALGTFVDGGWAAL